MTIDSEDLIAVPGVCGVSCVASPDNETLWPRGPVNLIYPHTPYSPFSVVSPFSVLPLVVRQRLHRSQMPGLAI